MRGALSRAAFARQLGVTPLTVYRWELPESAPQARRPRGLAVRRLAAFLQNGAPAAFDSAAAERVGTPSADLAGLWPVLARVTRAEFRLAEEELLGLMSSGALRSTAARALAAAGLACVQRWARDDLRSAFATLAPYLGEADADRLPPEVGAWVHAVAALIFAGFDGTLFDVGKVNAHIARAERLLPQFGHAEVRAILRHAEVMAAFNLGEPDLIRRSLDHARDGLFDATEPALRCLAGDARANEAMVHGQGSLARRRFEEVAQSAAEIGFRYVECRMRGFLAGRQLEEAVHPDEVLATTAVARAAAAPLTSGFSSVFLARVDGEALIRLARFEEARSVLERGDATLHALKWPAFQLIPTYARLCRYTGRAEDARGVAERLLAQESPLLRGLSRAYAEFSFGVAEWISGRPEAAAARFDGALAQAQAAGGWMFLQRECRVYGFAARVAAGRIDEAEASLTVTERLLEKLPAPWWTALLQRHKGILLCLKGQTALGRQKLQTALGTFMLANDLPEAALARRCLALAAEALGEHDAAEGLARTEEELRRIGMAMPPHLRAGAFPRGTSSAPATPSLVVPLQRLSVRGVGPLLLQQELIAVARELRPASLVRLEELDSDGAARVVAESGPDDQGPSERFDFGDGMGRRLRLVVSGPLDDSERGQLTSLCAFAGMALENAALRGFSNAPAEVRGAEDGLELPGFVAVSPTLRKLRSEVARLSGSRSTIIVTGESGVGKEVVTRAIHQLSTRRDRPYVALNCASVPRELFEGQLFGYRRGAYTGARTDHPGVIRAAAGGTLFLDEIGELPLELQPKLLRFLENGEVLPLGESRPVHVDVRVIAATHRDLSQLVREGRFREDLFYRLQVVPIRIPPLRDRPEDIMPLARHFIAQLAGPTTPPPALSPDALAALVAHRWPGNVRELRNVIERAMAYAPTPSVFTASHLRIESDKVG